MLIGHFETTVFLCASAMSPNVIPRDAKGYSFELVGLSVRPSVRHALFNRLQRRLLSGAFSITFCLITLTQLWPEFWLRREN